MIGEKVEAQFIRLPSSIIGLHDEYEAFCFNEACFYIVNQMQENKKPRWREDVKEKKIIRNENLHLADRLRKERG